MFGKSVVMVLSLMAGHASAQDSYVFGGLGSTKVDFDYTYTPADEVTAFDTSGVTGFLGYGMVIARQGQVDFLGEADISFGDMKSDLVSGDTTPCLASDQGCTGEVGSLVTLRLGAAASTGALRPFASLGLGIGDVKGSADLGACGVSGACDYDQTLVGLAGSLGATYALNDRWQLRGEVLYVNLGQPEFTNRVQVTTDDITLTQVRLGAQFSY